MNKKIAVFIIAIPFLLACGYYVFLAKDRYASISSIVVRQVGSAHPPQMPGLAAIMGGVNPTSREETLYLREYVLSHDMLAILQKKLAWSSHFNEQLRDPIYWLNNKASREDVLKFYRRMVRAEFDEINGLLTVEVESFDPEFSRTILALILAESESFVNEISHKMARVQMEFAESELERAQETYAEEQEKVIEFQNKNNMLDAEETAKSRSMILAQLEGELVRERANLKGLNASLGSSAPQVRQQQVRIRSLEQQLKAETQRLVSTADAKMLNVTAANYRNLMFGAKIAEEGYKFALSAVETARIETNKQIRSLVRVTTPVTAESAVYPRAVYILFSLFVGLLLAYGIARFVIATIRDHQD